MIILPVSAAIIRLMRLGLSAALSLIALSSCGDCEPENVDLVADTFPERFFHAAPSPAGDRIAAAVRGVAAPRARLVILDLDGDIVQTLGEDLPRMEHLRWATDGDSVFVRFLDESSIDRIAVDGSRQSVLSTPENWGSFDIAADRLVHGGGELRVFQWADGSEVARFPRELEASPPALSPDGRFAADVADSLRAIDIDSAEVFDLAGTSWLIPEKASRRLLRPVFEEFV